MEQDVFIKRLVQLRINKGVSAREMSLSIGQSPGYINSIENGVNYPKMENFWNICEYLGVSEMEFFDTENEDPIKERELRAALRGLKPDQLEHLLAIANAMKNKK